MRISDWSSDVCSSDLVLRSVAAVLRECIGDRGHAVRYGGDEFAVALDVDEPQALEIAESLRRRVGELSFVAAPGLRCTVSLGVASASPGMSLLRVVAAADSALSGAKDNGRDRVATPGRTPPHLGKSPWRGRVRQYGELPVVPV